MLVQDAGLHLLGLVDHQDRAHQGGLDVSLPAIPQQPGADPAVVRRELDIEQVAQFAIEVRNAGLWSGQNADREIPLGGQLLDQQAQTDRLPQPRFSRDQSEASLAHRVLHPPAEVLELGSEPEGFHRNLGSEGVPLQAIEGEQLLGHDCSSSVRIDWMWGAGVGSDASFGK